MKKILFITGTRADYGKLKSLIIESLKLKTVNIDLFITGMHMLSLYGRTEREILKEGYPNTYSFVNQRPEDSMDLILAKTVTGLSDYVFESKPDLIVVHGDRVEALAGCLVGALNNILVAHIEGGEVSGTIDESIRHAITKLAHIHLVANEIAKNRIVQMGENEEVVHIIGSPDIDVMKSSNLPSINKVKKRYDIYYDEYAIFMFHPVTTEIQNIKKQVKVLIDRLKVQDTNFIAVFPNNDMGSFYIRNELINWSNQSAKVSVFPSLRFEYFLTLLKNAKFIIGNSSAGIREAPIFGVPTINVGTRQNGRSLNNEILHCNTDKQSIDAALSQITSTKISETISEYGLGTSAEQFSKLLNKNYFFDQNIQKTFWDISK